MADFEGDRRRAPARDDVGRRIDRLQFRAHHGADQLGLAQASRLAGVHDRAALAQDGHPVGDREHLLQAMRDEDEAAARLTAPAHDVEEPIDLSGRKGGRRLVEDDQLRLNAERLRDLDELLLGRGEPADFPIERQRVRLSEARQQADRSAAQCAQVEPARLPQQRQEDVFQHGEVGNQAGFLHHDRDPDPQRFPGVTQPDLTVAVDDPAGVVDVVAGDDFGQRGFASAVGAEQSVDLTFAQGEIGAREGLRPIERLRDALDQEERPVGRLERSSQGHRVFSREKARWMRPGA